MPPPMEETIDLEIELEADPPEFPPEVPVSMAELVALMQAMSSLATATGTPPAKADIRRAHHLADELVRAIAGLRQTRARPKA